ncbi:hypothetical protein A7E78_01495 [Syntrophotalea acetylenivorans]|uniref:Uncharacterized protein n=1 Tax=Syntrophotalea acetylenivorans TaxID=1842532 RepID=A0A1L3GL36_9BACT|nr:hypothetical protein [Syntrophotalea acetylenivorans]APG26649.1 hypothetical protein A7E78_01495 [Syntrophotalea acetylenivorans]
MVDEKTALEESLGVPVCTCRQHWLRFSWEKTWRAQEKAEIRLDTTLGFNDRPGFRIGAALPFFPWDHQRKTPLKIQAVPMVLMDSHLYDYGDMSSEERQRQITTWLDEIKSVHGTATIIWHQRVMSRDYGWGPGYEQLLQILRDQ